MLIYELLAAMSLRESSKTGCLVAKSEQQPSVP